MQHTNLEPIKAMQSQQQAADTLVDAFGEFVAPLNLDTQALASQFHEVCRRKAVDTFGSREAYEFESLELETRVWDLADQLACRKDTETITQTVINWIQSNQKTPIEPAQLQSIKWMYTRSQTTKGGANALVSELDLDAPLRQMRSIAEEDRAADDCFYKYIFELVLLGDFSHAKAACVNSNNWLAHAALGIATSETNDVLVLQSCRDLCANLQLGKYERGFYGLLCGNLASAAPLCETWETLLLVHLKCGATLEAFERGVQRDHKLMLQHRDWRRKVALALIQERVPELVSELVGEFSLDSLEESALVQQPWLTRFLLHMLLSLNKPIDPVLTQVYIEIICMDPALVAQRLDLVPRYARFLAPSDQSRVYGYVLANITHPEIQIRQIKLAQNYNLDLEPILKYAVSLNFDLFINSLGESQVEAADAETDAKLVGALHWLVAAELWPSAVSALLRAYALFFTENRRTGAALLATQISAEYIRTHALDGLRSKLHEHPQLVDQLTRLKQCSQLAESLSSLDAWRNLDKSGVGWRSQGTKIIGFAIDAVSSTLPFGAFSTDKAMQEIRQKYIPQIVYELFDVLVEARIISKGYTNVALEFAVKIADEKLQLYKLFDANLLKALVVPALSLDN